MSLNWSVKDVKDFETVCFTTADADQRMRGVKKGDRMLSPISETLVWATMAIGMSKITEANHREFYARLRLWESTQGAALYVGSGPPLMLTLTDVREHIGLWTNASNVARNAWLNDLLNRVERDGVASEASTRSCRSIFEGFDVEA